MSYIRRKRTDGNQAEALADLKAAGIAVQLLTSVGGGCPDLLCALDGVNVLIELKDGRAFESDRKLTPAESRFLDSWPGPAFVALDGAEAVKLVRACAVEVNRCKKLAHQWADAIREVGRGEN